jgi:site-specific recombinase XerD
LRQFTAWCRARSVTLFAARRADIESFARELEAKGRARATVTRRLCTIAGFWSGLGGSGSRLRGCGGLAFFATFRSAQS